MHDRVTLKLNCSMVFSWKPLFLFIYGASPWQWETQQETQCGCVQACISMCASERVCILFMARNQLSLAHNGNVNSPERLSPTQGENWLGACCIFPNPNTEKQVAGLKFCPPFLSFPGAPHRALPLHYSNRSSKQVSIAIWKHIHIYTC